MNILTCTEIINGQCIEPVLVQGYVGLDTAVMAFAASVPASALMILLAHIVKNMRSTVHL